MTKITETKVNRILTDGIFVANIHYKSGAKRKLTFMEIASFTPWKRVATIKGWGHKCEEYFQKNKRILEQKFG